MLCFGLLGLLIFCPVAEKPAVVSDYCQNYHVIRPSQADTGETLRQIGRENTKWRAVCQLKPK